MEFINLSNAIARWGLTAAAAAVILVLVSTGSANPLRTASNAKKLAGVWQLQRTLNERDAKTSKIFLPVRETPQTLILAIEDGSDEITINEGFREFIQTQTLPTNGLATTQNVQQLGRVSTSAAWQKGRLVVEVVTAAGDKLIETFDLSADQKQLHVTLQYTAAASKRSIRVRRVYRRVAETGDGETADLGITVYPL